MGERTSSLRPRDYARHGFSRVLQRARLGQSLTREDLARGAGIKPAYVAKLENTSMLPRPDLLRRLASTLGVDSEALFEEAEAEGRAELDADPAATPTSSRWTAGDRLGSHRQTPQDPVESGPEPLPTWLAGLKEALDAVDESRRPAVGRHVMGYAQRLVDARVVDSDRTLDALDEIVRSVVLHLDGHDREDLRRAWQVVLAQLSHCAEADDPVDLQRLLVTAYDLATAHQSAGLRLATIPAHTPRGIWPRELAVDDDGQLWVNPLATAHPVARPHDQPIVTRQLDGRITADLTDLDEDVTLGSYDPDRHVVRVAR